MLKGRFWQAFWAFAIATMAVWVGYTSRRDSRATPRPSPSSEPSVLPVAAAPAATTLATASSKSAALPAAEVAPSAVASTMLAAKAEGKTGPEPEEEWPNVEVFAGLAGLWVGADKGDAIPNGPRGGKIVEGGFRAVFEHHKAKSKTPWNVTIWAPAKGHTGSKTISFGCGLYDEVHDAGQVAHGFVALTPGWRAGFCKGYGFDNALPVKVVLVAKGGHLSVSIFQDSPKLIFHAVVVRPEHGE